MCYAVFFNSPLIDYANCIHNSWVSMLKSIRSSFVIHNIARGVYLFIFIYHCIRALQNVSKCIIEMGARSVSQNLIFWYKSNIFLFGKNLHTKRDYLSASGQTEFWHKSVPLKNGKRWKKTCGNDPSTCRMWWFYTLITASAK